MGDNADNTTFLLQLTASIYYNEAAIGKGEEGEEECDGAGFEGAFLPMFPSFFQIYDYNNRPCTRLSSSLR